MKILSIDVGIKNLAYCLFDDGKIVLWDVINLCGKEPNCSQCKKKAKFTSVTTHYCLKHAKEDSSAFILPTADMSIKKIKKMTKDKLYEVIKNYNILLKPTDAKKENVLKTVLDFFDKKMLQSVKANSANDFDLIQLGIAMKKAFDVELANHLTTLDQIVIENQISPIANRMKSLQGMIAQYFIMHDITQIAFVSAANKLKVVGEIATDITEGGLNEDATSSYASRKKEGIRITLQLLEDKYPLWLAHFKTHKKKDDLADAFLQGYWFIYVK